VARGICSVYVYHGAARSTNVDELRQHDVIITTYNLLASQKLEGDGPATHTAPLQRIHWLRYSVEVPYIGAERGH